MKKIVARLMVTGLVSFRQLQIGKYGGLRLPYYPSLSAGRSVPTSPVSFLCILFTFCSFNLPCFLLPALAATLGFKSVTVTLLLTAPPWAFASLVALCNARHADITGERFWHIAAPALLGILGYIISLCTMNTAARYIALYVAPLGASRLP